MRQQQHSLIVSTNAMNMMSRRSTLSQQQSQLPGSMSQASQSRKRFYKDDKRDIAPRMVAINMRKKEEISNAYKARHTNVKLYRRYRDGDFPDLSLDSLALLLPLRAVILRDRLVAKEFFINAFSSYISSTENTDRDYLLDISQAVAGIFSNSINGDSVLVATLLSIALKQPQNFHLPLNELTVACKASGNFSLGTLFIEERLNVKEPDGESSSKRPAVNVSINEESETNHWLKLAELYHCLSEADVVTSILTDKLHVDDRLPVATAKMFEGDYDKAYQIFSGIVENVRIGDNFCFNSMFDCLEYMSDWETYTQAANRQIDNYEELWQNDWNQENLLSRIFTGETRLILEDIHKDDEFPRIVEQWMLMQPRASYILQNFSKELAMLTVAGKQFKDARVITDKALKQFLAEWARLDVMADKVREQKLTEIRLIAEIFSSVKLLLSSSNFSTFTTLEELYTRTLPSNTDPIKFWSHLVTYREYFQNLLTDLVADEALDEYKVSLKAAVVGQQTHLVSLGLAQKNLAFSQRIFQRFEDKSQHGKLVKHKLNFMEAKMNDNDPIKLCLAFRGFQAQISSDSDDELKSSAYEYIAEIGKILCDATAKTGVPTDCNECEIFKQYLPSNMPFTPQNYLDEAVNYLLKVSSSDGENFYKIAQYLFEAAENNTIDTNVSVQKRIISYATKALQFGSNQARLFFARILQFSDSIYDTDSELGKCFMENLTDVPEWMFICWIPQILSRLDLTAKSTLDPLLLRIATEYPNALYYPLCLKIEPELNPRPLVKELLGIIEKPLMRVFTKALSLLVLPSCKFLSQLNGASRKLRKCKSEQEMYAVLQECINICFDNEDMWGKIHQAKFSVLKKKLLNVMKEPGK